MNLRKLFAGALILTLLAALFWQHAVRASLQETNGLLRGNLAETEQLLAENRELASAGTSTDQTVESTTAELLKLQAEIRNLRVEHQQIERLRAENRRLRTQGSEGAKGRRFSEAEGYLSNELWQNVGFATPEAAVQTFFHALRQESYAEVIACFTQKEQRTLHPQFSDPNGNLDGPKIAAAFQPLIQVSGFRFAKVETTNDSARVGVQTVRGGVVFHISLQREADGWKLKDF
jgi:hypothetical protein